MAISPINRSPERLETLHYIVKHFATEDQIRNALDALPSHSKILAFLQQLLSEANNTKSFSA